MHHPRSALLVLLIACWYLVPESALAQTSPFMTGATSLQTNILAWLTPVAIILVMVLGGMAMANRIHEPRSFPGSDPRNFHAHLLATTREVGVEGLGAKTTLEWNDSRRREIGLGPAINELLHVRERWANVTNAALREADAAARVDHRTLQQQGIDREPQPSIPRAVYEMERHGYRTFVGDRLREEYAARVAARLAKSAESQPASAPKNAEDLRREARENWLRMRENANQNSVAQKPPRGRDDDFSL